ncbi:hypothetical protein MUP07_10375 [Candidatus Bathyarchaeota archaeon]|nr:hypothetical protein [Candidatus Bathyarchaeota archaeon]
MNRPRGAILVLTIIAALVTIYANVLGVMPQVLFDLIITIEAVVIAELILYEILRLSEETKLTINLHSKKEKVGFSVESENKTIKDAYPMFDGARYQWEDDGGLLRDTVDLYVGAKPCYFYPFTAREEEGEDGIISIVLTEVKRKRDIYFLEKEHKDIPIRIIGEGNETKKDYKLVSFYPYTHEQWLGLAAASVVGTFRLVEQKKRKRLGS